MPLAPPPKATPSSQWDTFDLDDDEGWQDMPVVRDEEANSLGLDDEDVKKYHYVSKASSAAKAGDAQGNATGNLIDFDDRGNEWRSKVEQNENDYTRVRLNDDDMDADEAYLKTKYLFDEDKAMTPLSQMQQTKNLLTEAQRIAYVGLCSLVSREMAQALKRVGSKDLHPAIHGMELWGMKIMGRLYYHMELETAEQKMIESLGEHGVNAMDLVPPLMTTHTVSNPEYDPTAASQKAQDDAKKASEAAELAAAEDDEDEDPQTLTTPGSKPSDLSILSPRDYVNNPDLLRTVDAQLQQQTTANVMTPSKPLAMPGVSTSLSTTDENVTLDIRWTVLCDLFLILIADSMYDARSRVLLETVAAKMGLGWLDVVKFEKRVTDALEIQEGVDKLEQKEILEGRQKSVKTRRYVMMGLATLGGGLVIGLSAGLLAPVIGAGLGAAFTTIGITGTTGFLAGAGGAAVITTGGVLTGSSIAGKGMARRTQQVHTFDLLPLHNNKRVSCIVTVPGFMSGKLDDPRLPFSVLDPIVGDVFSVLWEPEMMEEMGGALTILTSEVLSQVGTTVLQATVMTALMTALQWPIVLTKLGYLIDNPWSNALDRSKAAGLVLADVLLKRSLGVRPITLMGFSLGARAIFFCLLELAKHKAFGVVQDVFLLGATVTASTKEWHQARGVVSGRFVNGFARNDWLLNYLFRAVTMKSTIAGLRPVEHVPGLENVDVTDKIAGHMSYRTFMPMILDQLGFPVTATYFDEPEEPDMTVDRMVVREEDEKLKEEKSKFYIFARNNSTPASKHVTRPPGTGSTVQAPSSASSSSPKKDISDDSDLPERMSQHRVSTPPPPYPHPSSPVQDAQSSSSEEKPALPKRAGFDFQAIGEAIGKKDLNPETHKTPAPTVPLSVPQLRPEPPERTGSAPPLSHYSQDSDDDADVTPTGSPKTRQKRVSLDDDGDSTYPKPIRSLSEANNPHSFSTSQPSTNTLAYYQNPLSSISSGNDWGTPYTSAIDSTPWRANAQMTTGFGERSSHTPSYSQEPTLTFGTGSFSAGNPKPAETLSFGLVDGTISSTSLDPWSPGPTKKATGPSASNPWG